eukprot:c8994_g1_i1.p1 GENE.c8994_g1_i1~~c8994_g1_i1.p1  ORF type:complete len:332 (+),score=82.78 c8994_g1_i1:46-1041(+)
MERYAKWKDPGTGIHPFLESPKKNKPNSAEVIFGYLLVFPRLIFLVVTALWLGITTALFSLVPIPPLRRLLLRYSQAIGCRAVLFLLGFHFIDSRIVSPRQPSKRISDSPGKGIGSGEIIISNYTSYVQILYLAFRFSPTFVSLVRSGDKAGEYGYPRNFFGAILDLIHDREPDISKCIPIHQIVANAKRNSNGPVVIFPEATTSNGQMILPFLPSVFSPNLLRNGPKFHLISFKFDSDVPFVVSTFRRHFFRLLSTLNHSSQVRFCTREEVPNVPTAPFTTEQTNAFSAEIAKTLALLFHMIQSSLGLTQKSEFITYFVERESKGHRKTL